MESNSDINKSYTKHEVVAPQDNISLWIRDNRAVAMLSAFAIGVFFGALVRR